MKFWRGNKLSAQFDAEPLSLVPQFWASSQGAYVRQEGMSLDRALRSWLTDPDGFNSVWTDEKGYEELYQLVRDGWPQQRCLNCGAWEGEPCRSWCAYKPAGRAMPGKE